MTVALQGAPLKLALQQIEMQTSYKFAYVEDQIAGYDKLYVAKEKRSLSQTLTLLLQPTSLKYLRFVLNVIRNI